MTITRVQQILTHEETQELLGAMDHAYAQLVLAMMVYSGLRPCELVDLK